MEPWEALYGPNVGYALELYERYLQDPHSVDPASRELFDQLGPSKDAWATIATLARPAAGTAARTEPNGKQPQAGAKRAGASTAAEARPRREGVRPAQLTEEQVNKIVTTARLARGIREYGHLEADVDPLGAPRPSDPMLKPETHQLTRGDLESLPGTIVFPHEHATAGNAFQAMERLKGIYTGHIGYECDHVANYEERNWLHEVVEQGLFDEALSPEERRNLLERLTAVEGLERFIHTVYPGQKRFSIEGNDALVPMLDQLVKDAEAAGIREVLIGMAHRGRLNVLAHVLEKPYAGILAQFQGQARSKQVAVSDMNYGGDVKYHVGGQRAVRSRGKTNLEITLSNNPSHLEFVNPVVEGDTRAAQDDRSRRGKPSQDVNRALAVTIHGDAAFPAEGVVAETLNLSYLEGYQTGGTIHLIVNNQIGFTTIVAAGRSTTYASDLAKGFDIPVVHVNADDPEAALSAIRLAVAYRNRFHKDFLVDLMGYRRWGHNEGDEPAFTQPKLYRQISEHPTARAIYAQRLVENGILTSDEAETMNRDMQARLRRERDAAEEGHAPPLTATKDEESPLGTVGTAVPAKKLRELNEALLNRPKHFTPNAKLERLMIRRREQLEREGGIDWGLAEILAFGSILADGTPIRLSGQDTERGTFSQRHLILHDPETDSEFVPLQVIPQAKASFAVYNSPLSEAAVLGFEYGYSVHAPDALVLWEAQYGDFANAAQVLIDQFIASAEAKWHERPALALLLPHGYEGQGPEHSSARLERFLQLAGAGNIRVVVPTTAAQYFHLLRLQAATLSNGRKPMILLTPKSLLRRREASSSLADLSEGSFQPVIDDAAASSRPDTIRRLVLCSGKVGIDLQIQLDAQPSDSVAVARLEQVYPFPLEAIQDVVAPYPKLEDVAWVQEEPENMGAWTYVAPRLQSLLPPGLTLCYVGRSERASVAEGKPVAHEREQARIVREALQGDCDPVITTGRAADVD